MIIKFLKRLFGCHCSLTAQELHSFNTLCEAIRQHPIDLRNADLRGADLRSQNE